MGGAVRNLVLGNPPADWDLASNAQPDEIMSLFRHVIPTGIQHGTVTVRFRKKSYETTTFRIDGDYADARHPDSVEYTANIHEDLRRRDFTINAMAYDLHADELLDPHGGQEDLRRRRIKTVGDPLKRFSEDGLRIIRGLRFASTLSFNIHPETYRAMKLCSSYLQALSIERIREEFNKILHSPRPSLGMELAADIGILQYFIPPLNRSREIIEEDMGRPLFDRLLASCDHAPALNLELRFAALLHDIASSETSAGMIPQVPESADMAQTLCKQMKYPKSFERKVYRLIKHYAAARPDMSDAQIRRLMSTVGSDILPDLLNLRRAVIAGRHGPFPVQEQNRSSPAPIPWLDELEKKVLAILRNKTALTIAELAVNGHELHALAGIPKNREMRDILKQLLELVLEDPAMNQKDRLIQSAQKIYQQKIHNQKMPKNTQAEEYSKTLAPQEA